MLVYIGSDQFAFMQEDGTELVISENDILGLLSEIDDGKRVYNSPIADIAEKARLIRTAKRDAKSDTKKRG